MHAIITDELPVPPVRGHMPEENSFWPNHQALKTAIGAASRPTSDFIRTKTSKKADGTIICRGGGLGSDCTFAVKYNQVKRKNDDKSVRGASNLFISIL
jgi:hypothetical protein